MTIPEGRADVSAAIFFAGKCSNLGRIASGVARKISE